MEIQPKNCTVSILTEIPESLNDALLQYLEDHPKKERDQVFTAALSLFLMQNGNGSVNGAAARAYLDCLFGGSV